MNNNDEKAKAQNQLKALRAKIDEIEKSKDIDVLKNKYNEHLKEAQNRLNKISDKNKKAQFELQLKTLKNDGAKAITQNSAILLKKVNDSLKAFNVELFGEDDSVWIKCFNTLSTIGLSAFDDSTQARKLLDMGQEALDEGDIEELRGICVALLQMMPEFHNRAGNEADIAKNIGKIAGIKI